MSAISSREKNMLIIVGVITLYAFAALCYKKQIENWHLARKAYQIAERKYEDEKALIRARAEWDDRYEKVQSLMPVFPYDRDVDTHWLNVMDTVAQRNNLTITRRQASKELEVGDVFELPVECRDWEGTLESLVRFLYDLSQQGAMLDVRNLYVRPSPRPGFLKGSFTLFCAYMRGDEERAALPVAQDDETAENADSSEEVTDGKIPEEKPEGETRVTGTNTPPPAAESPGTVTEEPVSNATPAKVSTDKSPEEAEKKQGGSEPGK